MPGLALSRFVGEVIFIGDEIEIEPVWFEVDGVRYTKGKVRLCIRAPKDIKIDREEVRNRPDYRG